LFAIQSYVEFTVATVIACKHAFLWVESPHVLLPYLASCEWVGSLSPVRTSDY
jgi:hypothetical protein